MKEFKQQHPYDCCLAAIVSLFNLDYEATFPKEFRDEILEKKGTYGENVVKALEFAGFKKEVDYDSMYVPTTTPQGFTYHMIWGRKALLQVPSVNNPGASHMIAWDGFKVWDPSNLQRYNFIDHRTVIEWIWYFNETKHE